MWSIYIGPRRALAEPDTGHDQRYISLGADLKGLHGSNKLWEGLYIDTTEHLEVHEGYTFEGVELVPYTGGLAESAGSVLPGHIVMPPQLNIEPVIRTAEREKSRA